MTPILLDLSQLRESRERIDRTLAAASFPLEADDPFEVRAGVHLALEIQKDGTQFHLVGRVTTTLGLTCGRCLEPFSFPVDLSFNLLYVPHTANQGEGEVEVEDDDLSVAYYRNEGIDLGQLMREQFYLALPMKPLCRESCRGLCPTCGTNLNAATCSCVQAWTDPRLDGLRSLVDKPDRPD